MTTESIIDKIIYFFIKNKITEKDYLSNVLTNNQIEIDEYQFLELYNEIINSGLFDLKKENTKDSKDLLFIPNDKAQQKFKASTSYFDYKIAKDKKENDKSNSVVITGSKNVNVIQDSDFRDFINNEAVDAKTATDKQKSIEKSKIDIKVIWQYLAWIATISAAILAYYRFFKGQ